MLQTSTTPPPIVMAASLIFTQGNSDKEYNCQIVQQDQDAYNVNYQYGRRGNALTAGTKTSKPVDLQAAQKVFDKLLSEKIGKGYRRIDTTAEETSFTATSAPVEKFQAPQLLNEVSAEEVEDLLNDDSYCMQPKMDGKRILIAFNNGDFQVSNKLAKGCSVPSAITDQLASLTCDVEHVPVTDIHVDGELIGSKLYVFDALSLRGVNLKLWPFEVRQEQFSRVLGAKHLADDGNGPWPNLVPVETGFSTAKKRAMFNKIKVEKGEGVVFRRLDAPYTEGRPNAGGTALKFKFREEASFQCLGNSASGKRSVRLGLLDDNANLIEVGNVTVPPNQPVPEAGAVVEVIYLYMFQNGAVFQPVLKGIRDDVTPEECRLSQVTRLKAKVSDSDDD